MEKYIVEKKEEEEKVNGKFSPEFGYICTYVSTEAEILSTFIPFFQNVFW